MTEYDFNLIRMRFKETEEEVRWLKRKVEAMDNHIHRLEKQCQGRSSSSPESSTPTLPVSSSR